MKAEREKIVRVAGESDIIEAENFENNIKDGEIVSLITAEELFFNYKTDALAKDNYVTSIIRINDEVPVPFKLIRKYLGTSLAVKRLMSTDPIIAGSSSKEKLFLDVPNENIPITYHLIRRVTGRDGSFFRNPYYQTFLKAKADLGLKKELSNFKLPIMTDPQKIWNEGRVIHDAAYESKTIKFTNKHWGLWYFVTVDHYYMMEAGSREAMRQLVSFDVNLTGVQGEVMSSEEYIRFVEERPGHLSLAPLKLKYPSELNKSEDSPSLESLKEEPAIKVQSSQGTILSEAMQNKAILEKLLLTQETTTNAIKKFREDCKHLVRVCEGGKFICLACGKELSKGV